MAKSNAGRPTVINEKVLAKLQEAFLWGASDVEACLYAEIDTATLYRYQEKTPNYASKKAEWKENPALLARRNVFKSIEDEQNSRSKDKLNSKWYLERKVKSEFSQRQEVTGDNGSPIQIKTTVVNSDELKEFEEFIELKTKKELMKSKKDNKDL